MESKDNGEYSDTKYMCVDNKIYRCSTFVQFVMTKDKYDDLIDENEKLKKDIEKLKAKSKRLYAIINKNKTKREKQIDEGVEQFDEDEDPRDVYWRSIR